MATGVFVGVALLGGSLLMYMEYKRQKSYDVNYDTALESVSDVLRSRVKLVTDELVKVADRMVANMARRSKRENGTRIFNWMAPSGSGLFEGVKEAFSSATTVAHQLNPFHRSDDDD